jgi:hypothetical protein
MNFGIIRIFTSLRKILYANLRVAARRLQTAARKWY